MASNFKVLQVIPRLGYGGAETGCYDIAHYLPEKQCKSIIVTSGGPLLKYIKKEKVTVIRLPVHLKNPLILLFNTLALIFIQIIFNVDIVHARSRAPAWSCYIATKITRRKFVTTFHGTYNFNNVFKKFYNSIMLKSDLIIAGSNFIFSHINENYPEYLNSKKKFLVIFRGINTDYFDGSTILDTDEDKLLKKWEIKRGKKIILLPGRLTEWKGQELFLEAINLVNIQLGHEAFYAVILGSDQGRKIFKKKLIRLVDQYRLSNQVRFIDECKKMPVAYKIANIVISSSIEAESFGRVSVEAQSMEKPIIASNIGGSNETIVNNKTGILFESGNPEALSAKIVEVLQLDETTLKLMGNEGRKNVVKKFNIEKMCFTTYSEYKKLIN